MRQQRSGLHLLNKWVVIVLFLLFAVVYYFHGSGKRALDFSLYNWNGEKVTQKGLRGRVVVLAFSYAYCSVRCPVVTVRLSTLDDVMNAPREVVYLHIGVDPDMDTPEGRRKYFNLYRIDAEKDSRWMFVSGQKDELLRLWEFYNIDIKRVEDKRIPEGYYMEYTPKIIIIDKNGIIRYETDVDFLEEELVREIKEIL